MKDRSIRAVDLDGTLAEHHGFKGDDHIGKPIPAMLERVKGWLKNGERVVIHTARAHKAENIPAIRAWLKEHVGQMLPVTNRKLPQMKEFWDDRAVRVKKNTGRIMSKGVKQKARRMAVA